MQLLEGIPSILYKYRDYDNDFHKKLLFNQEVYLPSVEQFNDPFEGAIPYLYKAEELTPENIFIKMYKTAKSDNPNWTDEQLHNHCYEYQRRDYMSNDKHIENLVQETKEDIEKMFGILSLASSPLNYLMWSHYGESHYGFCIGLDSHIIFNMIGGALGPVSYKEDLPRFSLNDETSDFHRKILCTKSKVWEYEAEFRLVANGRARTSIKMPPEALKTIYFGCKMKYSTKIEIIEFAKKNLPGIEIYELKLSDNSFQLDCQLIYK